MKRISQKQLRKLAKSIGLEFCKYNESLLYLENARGKVAFYSHSLHLIKDFLLNQIKEKEYLQRQKEMKLYLQEKAQLREKLKPQNQPSLFDFVS